ncbi:spore cortex biosynthesis protein YabQ [Thermaerobacter litoralis]
MFSLTVQMYMLAVDVALGLTLGLLFDACRALRLVLGGGRPARRPWLDALLDAAFWAAALPLVILAWGWGNWGQVRTFTFLGLALGIAIYAGLGSPFLYPAFAATYRAVGQGTVRFVRWNRRAARWARRAAGWLLRGPFRLAMGILKPVTIPLGWLLAPVWVPVQRHLVAPARQAVERRLLAPLRQRMAAWRSSARVRWNRLRTALASWLRPGEGGASPPTAPPPA